MDLFFLRLQTNLSEDSPHILQMILPLDFVMVFLFIDVYEKTEALTAGFVMASCAILFDSIKLIVLLISFSSTLPHPTTYF